VNDRLRGPGPDAATTPLNDHTLTLVELGKVEAEVRGLSGSAGIDSLVRSTRGALE
jgi:hypothetical protein